MKYNLYLYTYYIDNRYPTNKLVGKFDLYADVINEIASSLSLEISRFASSECLPFLLEYARHRLDSNDMVKAESAWKKYENFHKCLATLHEINDEIKEWENQESRIPNENFQHAIETPSFVTLTQLKNESLGKREILNHSFSIQSAPELMYSATVHMTYYGNREDLYVIEDYEEDEYVNQFKTEEKMRESVVTFFSNVKNDLDYHENKIGEIISEIEDGGYRRYVDVKKLEDLAGDIDESLRVVNQLINSFRDGTWKDEAYNTIDDDAGYTIYSFEEFAEDGSDIEYCEDRPISYILKVKVPKN